MDLIKYDMTDIWAVAGDVVQPDTAKIRSGWGVEVVPRQWWNWFENRQDNNIAYMLQKGFPEWDAVTQYIANKSYVQRSGIIYKATATTTGVDPIGLTSWVKAFTDSTAYLEKLKSLAVVANTVPLINSLGNADSVPYGATGVGVLATGTPAAARTVIGAQLAQANLTALSGVAPVANGLPYFTSTTAMGIANLTAYGRSLINATDASAARVVLGLSSAATTGVMSGQLDRNVGALMTTGAFGIGRYVDLRGSVYERGIPSDIVGAGTVFGLADGGTAGLNIPGLPAGSTFGTLMCTAQWLDATALGATNRTFTTVGGRVFTQAQTSPSTWGVWTESWTAANLVKTTNQQDTTVGRMLQVGDFGYGNNSILITDPDTVYRGSGFYDVEPSLTWANRPLAGWTRIFHQSHANAAGYATQIASGDFASAGVTPRIFVRYCNGGTWTAWVELYHTGNTSAIVSQVQAGIQPTLNAKLDKTGGVATGQLGGTSLYAQQGSIYMRAPTGTSSGGFDVALGVDSPATFDGGGRFVITAASTYINNALTVTGAAGIQGNLSTSGLMTAQSAQINGSLTATGTIFAPAASISGDLTAAGLGYFAGGTSGGIQLASGVVNVYPAGNVSAGNSHVWFRDLAGGTRGILYSQPDGTMTIQAAGVICANFRSSGISNFNGTTHSTVSATGRISSSQDLLSSGVVYAGAGAAYLNSDGNVYGGTWGGGWLSNWVINNFVQSAGVMTTIAAQTAGAVGTYALAYVGSSTTGPNWLVAGTSIYWSAAAGGTNGGAVGAGTWRLMGYINAANQAYGVSLYLRVS